MKLKKHHINTRTFLNGLLSKGAVPLRLLVLFLCNSVLISCSDFVEVNPPKNILISETVFNDPATVESALANIYYKAREQGMVSGTTGLTTLLGIYSDELDYYGSDANLSELYHHNILASNNRILSWWNNAYNLIYSANDIILNLEDSDALTIEEKSIYRGQALFIRAYFHSLLVSLFGDVPYITTTDYQENNEVHRLSVSQVYELILSDLADATDFLKSMSGKSGERVLPGQDVAKALSARIYLYTEQWELAASTATELINAYDLEQNVGDVFLKGSSETIWQLKPGTNPRNTREANQLIIQLIPGQSYSMTATLLSKFEDGDLRFTHWTGTKSNADNTITLYFPYKYKALFTEQESLEYSILFRVAEQYLIRAEARIHMGDILGAQQDINAIRSRAGLPETSATNESELLDAIIRERHVELFAEQGHRWFDLKRTGNAGAVLSKIKPNWQDTDILLPIPVVELEINPNLSPQNAGY